MPIRPVRAIGLLALTAAAGLLTACTTTTTDPAPSGVTRLAEPYAVDHAAWRNAGYRWEWTSTPPMSRGGQLQFVDAYEDLLVVQDTGAVISVVEAPTGRVRWTIQAAQTNTRFLGNVRRENSVVVTNETVLLEYELSSGNTLDRTDVEGIATTPPVFFGNLAVLGSAGRLIAIDVASNIRVWEYGMDGLIETTPLKLGEERVAAVSTRGEIRSIYVNDARSQSSARISGDAGADLVSNGEFLFIASLDQSVYGYDLADGSRLWRLRTPAPVTVQPVLIDGRLYVSTAETGLAALDEFTGEIVWSNPALAGWVVTTNDGDLMVWTGGELLRVDAERGDLIARQRLDGLAGLRSDRKIDGNIYAVAQTGAIAKFSPR